MFGQRKKEKQDPPAPGAPEARDGLLTGCMQTRPINLASVLEHAGLNHSRQEVVSMLPEGVKHRQTYAETLARTKQLANALRTDLDVQPGMRVATLAWNTHRHLEAWYAISGQGAVCHTVNPRLFPEQIVFIIGQAANEVVFFDITFTPLIDGIRAHLPKVRHWVAMTDRAHMPEGDYVCFEELLEGKSSDFNWPLFDENTASSLCYTSGTTGDPKGVLYSHRSNILQAYCIASKDVMGMGANDTALMVVPMFHANSWGMAYAVPMVGAKLVLPGMALDGASTHKLITEEGVKFSAAVPTVWNMLLQHLEQTGASLEPLEGVMIGGAAVPRSMIDVFDRKYGVDVVHGWGMTEMSPLGTCNRPLPHKKAEDREAWLDEKAKQGRPPFGVELKIVDDNGADLPRDGETSGRLLVRGPWIAESYFGRDEKILDDDGWFDTGDIATLDADGMMQITDRAKDVIKSGGEWISSVELENSAAGHACVGMACAIGVKHEKWGERPLLLVKLKEGVEPDAAGIRAHLEALIAKWQLPDDIVFVDDLPLTATGKFDKKVLRAQYQDHLVSKPAAE